MRKHPNLKTFFLIIAVALISMAFGGELALKFRHYVQKNRVESDLGNRLALEFADREKSDLGDAIEVNLIINELNQGKVDDAKLVLNDKLDSYILEIGSSLNDLDDTNQAVARVFFGKIADARRKYPVDNPEMPESVKKEVAAILDESIKK